MKYDITNDHCHLKQISTLNQPQFLWLVYAKCTRVVGFISTNLLKMKHWMKHWMKYEEKTLTFETNCVCKMHEGEKEAAVVVLRAEDVHQVRFYCNQMSIAQSSSFKRNMNINCRQIWMVTQLSGETCPLGTKPDSHFVLFICTNTEMHTAT